MTPRRGPRIYVELVVVVGGCEDTEFRDASRRLLETFRRGDMTLVISELTLRELESAPAPVRDALGRIPAELIEVLPLSREAEDLASAYVADGAIGTRMRADRQPDAYPRLQRRQSEAGVSSVGDPDPARDRGR